MSLYSFLKGSFRLLPRNLREVVSTTIGQERLHRIKGIARGHDDIYHAEYYKFLDKTTSRSAPAIADSIIESFYPDSVLDVGCGTGALLHELRKRDVAGTGLEYSGEAIKYCRERDLDVVKFDLESGTNPFRERKFNVVISMEVAEHLPEEVADKFVDLICEYGDQIVFTAATPGQGGKDHVNEQPHQYWIDKFHSRGFQFLEKQSEEWRQKWKNEDVASWFSQNLMLFNKIAI